MWHNVSIAQDRGGHLEIIQNGRCCKTKNESVRYRTTKLHCLAIAQLFDYAWCTRWRKASMDQESGGHFKIKMEVLSYKILIAIIKICCMGIITLLKKHDDALSPYW